MHRSEFAIALLAAGLAAGHAAARQEVTVVTWGGAYEAAQRTAIFEPFTGKTGISVGVRRHDGRPETLRIRSEPEAWDVVDLIEDQAIAACKSGLLRRLDHAAIVEAAPAASLEADFTAGAFRECSIAQNAFASVIAYNEDAFPGAKPRRIEDFFDLDAFPGNRAVERSPDAILEWALLAEGVPPSQVYDLLSTPRGLRLAFRKLDTIRDSIIWWTDVAAATELLRNGRASMASGYNGRFFAAAQDRGAPIIIVWDGQVIGYEVWAISAASRNVKAAEAFIRFATAPERMARLAEKIPYGPTRQSAMERIGLDPERRVPMRLHLPNAPGHMKRALVRDSAWYAHTATLRKRRFANWLSGK